MAGGRPRAVAYTAMNFIVDVFTVGLRVTEMFVGSEYELGELVFHDFSLLHRSVTCLKQFVTAYHATHTEGCEMFGYVCLLGICLHWPAITNHLDKNYKTWARTRIICTAILVVVGVSLMCLGMVIPKNHAWDWHNTVVHSFNILFICLDAGLLVHSKVKENGGNKILVRDLLVVLAETFITIYRFVDSIGKTHSFWDAQNILHLIGSGLPVLIGACQIGWIMSKDDIISMVFNLLRKMPRVLVPEEEPTSDTAAIEGDVGGDVGDMVVEEDVEVVVAPSA